MTAWWQRWHRGHWWTRWSLKLVLFLAALTLVLFPKIWLLPTWVSRLENMNSVLQPDQPGLEPLEQIVRARVPAGASGRQTLGVVERVVYEHIPYAWDWDVWGVVDYLPTTAEVLKNGRGDCEARAVVAASLLRRMNFEAWLVTDLKHMWVATPTGETMSPGAGQQTLAGGPAGTEVKLTTGALANLGRGMTYGVAVFPLTRELIILAALCALTIHPRSGATRRVIGCVLLVFGLGLLRDAGAAGWSFSDHPMLAWSGWILAVAGWLTLAIRAGGRRSPEAQPG